MTTGAAWRRHGPLLVALALAALVGASFALLVPHGLPYDEPSYWATTEYYRVHHSLPVLGQPGVTYEAQHPPLSFVLTALGSAAGGLFSSSEAVRLLAARLVGGLQLLGALVLLDRILRRLTSSVPGRFVALLAIGIVPMFAAMAWSVQNDVTMLLFGFAAIELALARADRSGPGLSVLSALGVGCLVGLAVLSKTTAWPLLPACVAWLGWRTWPQLSRALRASAAIACGAVLTCGWWFAWSLHVYGRLLQGAVPAARPGAGASTVPTGGLHELARAAKTFVTYLWLPTEYYRNVIHAPAVLQAVIGVLTVGVVAVAVSAVVRSKGGTKAGRRCAAPPVADRRRSAWVLVVVTAASSIASWKLAGVVVPFIDTRSLAPRAAYLVLPLWAGLVAVAFGRVTMRLPGRSRLFAAVLAAALVLTLDAWTLAAVRALGPRAHGFLLS